MQIAGSTLFTRATWGTTFLRMTILTGASTAFSKSHGESSALSEVKVGDILDIEGALVVSTDNLSINASKIRDHSLDKETKSLIGYVSAVNVASSTFSLVNATFGTTAVRVSTSTIVKKGSKTIGLADIVKNDKVLSASGSYDYTSVNITPKTSILNNKRAKVSLVRFAPGDTVRVYGSIGDQTPGIIAAEVVRDTSF